MKWFIIFDRGSQAFQNKRHSVTWDHLNVGNVVSSVMSALKKFFFFGASLPEINKFNKPFIKLNLM